MQDTEHIAYTQEGQSMLSEQDSCESYYGICRWWAASGEPG